MLGHLPIRPYKREDKLVIRTAPEISGPWSEPEVFFRPDRAKPAPRSAS